MESADIVNSNTDKKKSTILAYLKKNKKKQTLFTGVLRLFLMCQGSALEIWSA